PAGEFIWIALKAPVPLRLVPPLLFKFNRGVVIVMLLSLAAVTKLLMVVVVEAPLVVMLTGPPLKFKVVAEPPESANIMFCVEAGAIVIAPPTVAIAAVDPEGP